MPTFFVIYNVKGLALSECTSWLKWLNKLVYEGRLI
jgi:hypothetical protein